MDHDAHQLRTYLADKVGDSLRSIVSYDAEGQEVIYLRGDTQAELSSEQAKGQIDFLREREDLESARERLGLGGNLRCTVYCWSDRIGLHFPQTPQSGTLVTVDQSVASSLDSFVTECKEVLDQ